MRGRAGNDASAERGTHDHVVFHMRGGGTITYNDPRRFGFMMLIPSKELSEHPLLHHLGIEPLGEALTPAYLAQHARGKKVALKPFLADQRIIAGLGNIYACEALYRARLSPLARRGDDRLQDRQAERARRGVGAGGPRRARGRYRRRRLDAARLSPGERRGRRLPACVLRLRPRRRAVPAQGVRRHACAASCSPADRRSTAPSASARRRPARWSACANRRAGKRARSRRS